MNKNFEFEKEVARDCRKQVASELCSSSQLGILSYVAMYIAIIHQPVTVSSSMHMQPKTCTNEAFSSTSTRFNPYFGWYKVTTPAQSRD